MHDEACKAGRRTRASGEAEAKRASQYPQRSRPSEQRHNDERRELRLSPRSSPKQGRIKTPGRVCVGERCNRYPKDATASRKGNGINPTGDDEAKIDNGFSPGLASLVYYLPIRPDQTSLILLDSGLLNGIRLPADCAAMTGSATRISQHRFPAPWFSPSGLE